MKAHLRVFSNNFPIPFAIHTVTVIRSGWFRDGGAAREDWDAATTHEVPNCSIQPGEKWEHNINADNAVNRFSIWMPEDTDIRSTDRVSFVLGSRSYNHLPVDGNPNVWIDPRGIQSHILINVLDSREAEYLPYEGGENAR